MKEYIEKRAIEIADYIIRKEQLSDRQLVYMESVNPQFIKM